MSLDLIPEARRQIEICNACRYCEGYCSVFPAITRQRAFADGDIIQLANLCHNCRGCYYACQYTAPHEFDLNLPRVLADLRTQSWKDYAWPRGWARVLDRSGLWISALFVLALAGLFLAIQSFGQTGGEGFYAYLSHAAMVAIFAPAFLFPLLAVAVSLRQFWRDTGGGAVTLAGLTSALSSAGRMTNLGGGHGEGCNFEDEDRYSNTRRWYHQATLYGFLMCFGATSAGTVLHYVFGLEAPYAWYSLPKLLGVPGGILLCAGTAGLAALKLKADPKLGATHAWGGEMAFVVLLFVVSATGLALYAATGTAAVPGLLALHLSAVLTFFLMTPYSKMVHGLFRLAALVRDAQQNRA
ncbi:MAG: tricarballylate utilization 4Fe-4S protein TcuB [Pseudomonadota bacterium]